MAAGAASRIEPRDKVAAFKRRAERSRRDLVAFFEFVMREEKTRVRMLAAAHQRALFSFVQHPVHARVVVILPVDHSKSFAMLTYALFLLAQDTNRRGLILSKTQHQAQKLVNLMRQIIDEEPRLRLVNPRMRRSARQGDPWSDTRFTVQRDLGAKDPSFMAAGLETGIAGGRLDFCLADDLLDLDNTRTPERRLATKTFVDTILSARMVADSRIVFTNTVFHSQDLVTVMSKPLPDGYGLPALIMSAAGDVWVRNADRRWVCDELVSAGTGDPGHYRLAEHEPDDENLVTLWPERYPRARLEEKRAEYAHNPGAFNRIYLSNSRDDSTAICKQEFVDACLAAARAAGVTALATSYGTKAGEVNPTFTGVDLAVSKRDTADMTAFFTFEARPDGTKRILDIEFGRWDALAIAEKAIFKARVFRSALAVENVGAQNYLVDVIREKLSSGRRDSGGREELAQYVSVNAKTTTEGSKANADYGVTSLFYEMARGQWLIPNVEGSMDRRVREFVNACLDYQPAAHTHDVLMASFIARWLASDWGVLGRRGLEGSGSAGSVLIR